MFLSRWCKIFECGDVVAIFHTLTFSLVFLSKSSYDKLLNIHNVSHRLSKEKIISVIGNSAFKYMVKGGIIVSLESLDEDVFYRVRDRAVSSVKLNVLYILLTDGCNLKCTY